MSRSLITLALIVVTAACGSSAPKSPEKTPPAKAPALLQTGEPVKFEVLETFLPGEDFAKANGWQRSDLTGMALTVPIRGSQASVTLRKDGVEIVVNIIDTVFNQSLYAPVAAFLTEGFSSKSPDGFKRATTMQGQPAFEEWTRADRTGGVTVLVGKRYLLHVQGTGIDTTDVVTRVATAIDLAKLAVLQ